MNPTFCIVDASCCAKSSKEPIELPKGKGTLASFSFEQHAPIRLGGHSLRSRERLLWWSTHSSSVSGVFRLNDNLMALYQQYILVTVLHRHQHCPLLLSNIWLTFSQASFAQNALIFLMIALSRCSILFELAILNIKQFWN